MSRWTPCKRPEFIRRLRALGLDGPFAGGRHSFMFYSRRRPTIPSNPEYSVPQLRELLKEVGQLLERPVTLEEWDEL